MPTRPSIAARAGITAIIGALSVTASVADAQSPVASSQTPVEGRVPDGRLVMERFGQAPDGSTMELDFDRRQLWLVRPDGTDLHELAPGKPTSGKVAPDVSPDGTRIAFASWADLVQVYEVAVDRGDPRLISTDCSGKDTECQEYDPAYSPDATKVAVGRWEVIDGEAWSWVAIRDLVSGARTDLVATRVASDAGWVAQPSWSPDASRVAYHRTPDVTDGYPLGIGGWIVDVTGGAPGQLQTPNGEDAADLDWSPDGDRIVYSTVGAREFEGVESPPARIVSVRPDGSDPVVLCDDSLATDDGCWGPSWMPDGDQVLFYGYRTWNLVGTDGTGNAPIDAADLTWFGTEPGQGFGYFARWLPDR